VHEECSVSVVKFLAARPKMKQDTQTFLSRSRQPSFNSIEKIGQYLGEEYA
jgi:hypothetical protein